MCLKIFLALLVLFSSAVGRAGLPNLIPIESVEAGIGAWQEMPFGQMRVLSCTSGVKDLSMVVGGLQVKLLPGWVMKKPTLKPLSEQYPSWIEMPVAAGNGQNPIYQGEVLIPFIYSRPPSDKTDFDLGVQGAFPVCQKTHCMTVPLRMQIKLSPDEADYTTACPYLVEQQRQAPLPAEILGIKGYAWPDGDEIQMAFTGLKGADVAFLQTTGQSFSVQETRLEKTGALLRVKTTPWALGVAQEWILITDRGFFKVPVEMRKTSVDLPSAPPKKTIWFLGWEFFFLTPLFIWWGLGCARTTKVWKKDIISFGALIPVVLILKGLMTLYCPLDFVGYACVILGLVCLFPPTRKISVLGMCLLWPYFPEIPKLEVAVFTVWMLVMLIEIMIPFILLYVKADEIGKILRDLKKAHFFTFNLIFLIPTVCLFVSFVGCSIQRPVVFSDALNQNGFSVVASPQEQSVWKEKAYLIAPNSILGRALQKMYNRTTVVVWQDQNGRLILTPDISFKQARDAISNWQNYHAVNRP